MDKMNDVKNKDSEKLNDLNNTLGNIENELLYKALDRSRGEAEKAYDFINQMADADLIDIECDDCGEEQPDGGDAPNGDGVETDGDS